MDLLRRPYRYVWKGYIYTVLQYSIYVDYDIECCVGTSMNLLTRLCMYVCIGYIFTVLQSRDYVDYVIELYKGISKKFPKPPI
jgi:hypothetical protein